MVVLLASCQWQLPQSIEVKTTPTVTVPGGTVSQRISDIEQITDLEEMFAGVFDSGARVATNPYTYRGTMGPLTVSVDDFVTDTGISEEQDVAPFEVTNVDLSAITLPSSNTSFPLPTADGTVTLPSFTVNAPSVAGFVETTIGIGTLDITIGDGVSSLDAGNYTLTVDVTGAAATSASFSDSYSYTGPTQLSVSVDLAGLNFVDGGTISVDISFDWTGATPVASVPLDLSFSLTELSELILDVGTNPLSAFSLSPVALPEELRRQLESIEINTVTSEIYVDVTADLLTSIDLTLQSAALFAGGVSNTQTIAAGVATPQSLVFPITATDIVLIDPDDAGPPPVGAIDEIDLSIQTDIAGHNAGTGYLTLVDVPMSGSLVSTIDATVGVTLEALSVTLRDIADILDGFAFSLNSEELASFDTLPSWLYFVSLPVRLELTGTPDPADVPAIALRITATSGVDTEELLFSGIGLDSGPVEENIAPLINMRPDTVDLTIEPDDLLADNSVTLGPGDSLSATLEVDLVFDLQVIPETGDTVSLIEEFFGTDGFTMDGDALMRSGPDDYAEIFGNMSAARLDIDIATNTTGLDGLSYEIRGDTDWVISSGVFDEGLVSIGLTQSDLTRIQETYPFSPTFDVMLERRDGTESYSLNMDGELEASVALVVVGDVDYTFSFAGWGE